MLWTAADYCWTCGKLIKRSISTTENVMDNETLRSIIYNPLDSLLEQIAATPTNVTTEDQAFPDSDRRVLMVTSFFVLLFLECQRL